MEIKIDVARTEILKMVEHMGDSYKKAALIRALDALELSENLTFCPECKYYYAPVCTFYKWLPMVSRHGFCYHGEPGQYEGDVPKIEVRNG